MTKSLVINTLVVLSFTAFFVYLCFAFAVWQFYPGEWGEEPRFMAASIWGLFNTCVSPVIVARMEESE